MWSVVLAALQEEHSDATVSKLCRREDIGRREGGWMVHPGPSEDHGLDAVAIV
jgi:hypothetical protein